MTTVEAEPTAVERAWVRVTLRQHASMGTGARSDFRQQTFDHVPGSVLRGACAAVWIRDHTTEPAADPVFHEIFEGEGTFGPLHTAESLPVPLSVRTHKNHPGPGCTRLWWDQALGDTAESCPNCGERLEASRGEPIGNVAVRHSKRVELTEDGVAVKEKLFERSALPSGTTFAGWVTGPALRALSDGDAPVTRLKLGGERSIRGAAVVAFDRAHTPAPVECDGDTVILRLCSPGIFVDAFGLPTDRPDQVELSERLGTDATIERAWTRWTSAGGWHAASGLPKPVDRAVAAGSTYVVRCGQVPSEQRRQALLVGGIGLRRREGFGALYLPPDRALTEFGAAYRDGEPVTGFTDWPKVAAHLRKRSTDWPSNPHQDQRILDALRKPMSPAQHAALSHLLSITDHAVYDAVLDRLGRS
jgi:CRISPR-associated protein Csx10